MGDKLNSVLLMAAVALISLGVSVIRGDPTNPKTVVLGIVILVVGASLGLLYKKYFKEEVVALLEEKLSIKEE